MRPINNRWKGMLTTKNAEEVAKMFLSIFEGKHFTYVRVRPSMVPKIDDNPALVDTRVDVHTEVILDRTRNGQCVVPVTAEATDNSTMLVISTSEYLCMYDTTLTDLVGKYDYTHKNPYISFDGDRCEIKNQTPCGDQFVDVFVLETQ